MGIFYLSPFYSLKFLERTPGRRRPDFPLTASGPTSLFVRLNRNDKQNAAAGVIAIFSKQGDLYNYYDFVQFVRFLRFL